MNRLDVYTAVHKMQRARLFDLVVEVGRTDPADTVTAARLVAAVDALADELVAHAEHEDRFIHPLLREKAPTISARLEADHLELDHKLHHLRRVAASSLLTPGDPNDLYRVLATFTASYLEHVAVEEDEALPALWGSCSDEELMGILIAFKRSRSEAENLTTVLAQLATLNPAEIARMVSFGLGPVSGADLIEVLATLLNPTQLGALRLRELV